MACLEFEWNNQSDLSNHFGSWLPEIWTRERTVTSKAQVPFTIYCAATAEKTRPCLEVWKLPQRSCQQRTDAIAQLCATNVYQDAVQTASCDSTCSLWLCTIPLCSQQAARQKNNLQLDHQFTGQHCRVLRHSKDHSGAQTGDAKGQLVRNGHQQERCTFSSLLWSVGCTEAALRKHQG